MNRKTSAKESGMSSSHIRKTELGGDIVLKWRILFYSDLNHNIDCTIYQYPDAMNLPGTLSPFLLQVSPQTANWLQGYFYHSTTPPSPAVNPAGTDVFSSIGPRSVFLLPPAAVWLVADLLLSFFCSKDHFLDHHLENLPVSRGNLLNSWPPSPTYSQSFFCDTIPPFLLNKF